MSARKFTVKGDGNGGFDINVQKAVLRRYGPFWLLVFMVLSGLGSRLGAEAWALIVERRAVEEKVRSNAAGINELRKDFDGLAVDIRVWKGEVREDLAEIKAAITAKEGS